MYQREIDAAEKARELSAVNAKARRANKAAGDGGNGWGAGPAHGGAAVLGDGAAANSGPQFASIASGGLMPGLVSGSLMPSGYMSPYYMPGMPGMPGMPYFPGMAPRTGHVASPGAADVANDKAAEDKGGGEKGDSESATFDGQEKGKPPYPMFPYGKASQSPRSFLIPFVPPVILLFRTSHDIRDQGISPLLRFSPFLLYHTSTS